MNYNSYSVQCCQVLQFYALQIWSVIFGPSFSCPSFSVDPLVDSQYKIFSTHFASGDGGGEGDAFGRSRWSLVTSTCNELCENPPRCGSWQLWRPTLLSLTVNSSPRSSSSSSSTPASFSRTPGLQYRAAWNTVVWGAFPTAGGVAERRPDERLRRKTVRYCGETAAVRPDSLGDTLPSGRRHN